MLSLQLQKKCCVALLGLGLFGSQISRVGLSRRRDHCVRKRHSSIRLPTVWCCCHVHLCYLSAARATGIGGFSLCLRSRSSLPSTIVSPLPSVVPAFQHALYPLHCPSDLCYTHTHPHTHNPPPHHTHTQDSGGHGDTLKELVDNVKDTLTGKKHKDDK